MASLGMVLAVVGGIAALAGGIWLLVLAFQESVLWGLGSLFVPFVIIVFAIMHWQNAAKPFGIYLAGVAMYVIGSAIGIGGLPHS